MRNDRTEYPEQYCSNWASARAILITKSVRSKLSATEGPLKKRPMHSQDERKEHKLVLPRGSERTPWPLRDLLQDSVLSNSKDLR